MFDGNRLRKLRKDKRLTMKDFGAKFNLAESTISGYENGTRNPDLVTIDKIAKFFDVSVDYLMGRTDNPRSPDQINEPTAKEQAEFEAFINNPQHGIFFKDYLSAPEERREEMRQIFKILQEKEKGRKPGDLQGE